jgi:3-methylcrotonyl-CoA carboxylase alpha subunit/acetyl-CoA/propionyl-CoA carboxylase biotin carboxyl carrier protein
MPSTPSTFSTLLVANRGEIACRVIRAAREVGLRTVAVYSDVDAGALHVQLADTAVRIGPGPAAESYLSIPALLAAAAATGADAVHPGYGFLSERAEFARACRDAGLVFVGPSAEVIDLLGRKDVARAEAVKAGVPVLPAVEGGSDEELVAAAGAELGVPLLVKAAAGGGGKGMRVVRDLGELPAALAAARREAAAAFGDDTLLVERYVERGRHIEVQVLADSHGNVVHLHERDCSVQRRHQKVIEEAPAVAISDAVRATVTTAAVELARHVGYVNAGTVEFLVDGDEAYLLEVNTRLQVEHPVTEAITGIDLVAAQLAIAQGEALPFTQEDITVRGHAMEVRVYAEDPDSGFLPQAGRAEVVRWPAHARVDAALVGGQEVSTHYDPMLGKVIVFGANREAARQLLLSALDDTAVVGLTTNLGFLRDLAASAAFTSSAIDTAWLDREPIPRADPAESVSAAAAAWALTATPSAGSAPGGHPFGTRDGWRLGGPPAGTPVTLSGPGSAPRTLVVAPAAGTVTDHQTAGTVTVRSTSRGRDGLLSISLDHAGTRGAAFVHAAAGRLSVTRHGRTTVWTQPRAAAADAETSSGRIEAPMPGTVLAVDVAPGDRVSAGQRLGVLEAMKMEHALQAPFSGRVSAVEIGVGDQVTLGQPLFVVDEVTAEVDA